MAFAQAAPRQPGDQVNPDDPAWAELASAGLGVYVHVPFCARRCGYCDFDAFAGVDHLMAQYVEAVVAEIAERVREPATTVFVGGGTPSCLPAPLLGRLLNAIPHHRGAEFTVEMNPESATVAVLETARDAGANRVSVGMQSHVPAVLAYLDRRHDPQAVPKVVEAARLAGFDDVSLDLIYGVPGESRADWLTSVDAALSLEVDHISCYALTVEPNTPLGRAIASGRQRPPDDDDCADKLADAAARLRQAGFFRYEISNWGRQKPCLHNLRYWSGGAYVGVGCAAHSLDLSGCQPVRSWNTSDLRAYLRAASDGVTTHAGHEVIEAATASEERLQLGLRRACGIDICPDQATRVPQNLVDAGFICIDNDRLRLTERGMAVASSVTVDVSLALWS